MVCYGADGAVGMVVQAVVVVMDDRVDLGAKEQQQNQRRQVAGYGSP